MQTKQIRYSLCALALAAASLVSTSTARAAVGDWFSDDCAADQSVSASSASSPYVVESPDGGYGDRATCPWWVTDVTNAQGQDLSWAPAPPTPHPETPEQCKGTSYSWVLARHEYGNVYTVVAEGTAVGHWDIAVGCVFPYAHTEGGLSVAGSAANTYRFLLRALTSTGAARNVRGTIWS